MESGQHREWQGVGAKTFGVHIVVTVIAGRGKPTGEGTD